jgi:hypothetical protein
VRVVSFIAMLAVACGNHEREAVPPAASSSASSAQSDVVAPPKATAHELVIATASCLLGPLWSEAEGETGGSERRAATAKRCAAVVHAVTGEDDPTKVEALRMLDASMTDPLVAKVKELDPSNDLARFASSLVMASREAASARRAAAKVRADIERLRSDKDKATARERDADRLSADEADVVPALRTGAGLESLVHYAGAHAAEAHAIGVLLALSRVRAAQDLPKHMKLYTVAPAYAAVFGVQPPPLSEHAKDKLKPGAWLAYVTSVAAACGHPVPETAKKPKEREPLAWSGVLAGFVDRLKAAQPEIQDQGLADVVKLAIERLEPRSPPQ